MRARHISLRVPWHDAAWDGTVCRDPEANCHCVEYQNISAARDVAVEVTQRGVSFSELPNGKLPPCAKESSGFLSPSEWEASHSHPYREWLKDTHGHLDVTARRVDPYTALAVPFRWLDRNNAEEFTQSQILDPLPEDTWPAKYSSGWVFQPHVQEAILDGFFEPVRPQESLAFFYTKSRQPLFEDVTRLVVGVGLVNSVGPTRYYRNSTKPGAPDHPIWERDVAHTLRPGGIGGLLVPYHQYLAPTGDADLDEERRSKARELRITPEDSHTVQFSYRSEHVSDDAAVSVLTQAIRVVHLLREHGIAKGDWVACEQWLNGQLASAWTLRGEHPGLGPVLQAAGLPMAVSLVHHLDSVDPGFRLDPWRTVSRVLDGTAPPPHARYQKEIDAFAKEWLLLANSPERLRLAEALSRVALDIDQAKRWWSHGSRFETTGIHLGDLAIVGNPYLLSEYDRGAGGFGNVTFATVDRSIVGDQASATDVSGNDPRRFRAAVVGVLREAESEGDTLLSIDDVRGRAAELPVPTPVEIGQDWVAAHAGELSGLVNVQDEDGWVQLTRRASIAGALRRKLGARARKGLPPIDESWGPLLDASIRSKTGEFDEIREKQHDRVTAALREQERALERIVSRKLTVLVGRAGTGKTTVLGALSRSDKLGGPILFLAPTGKARVRLATNVASGNGVQTVAQFLYSQGAYDSLTQSPVILEEGRYDGHRTVVIDEASMLTEETLLAVLATFSPNVSRLILVGDTAQLPPIGPGRPFADLVAYLSGEIVFDDAEDSPEKVDARGGAHARLTVEVRNTNGEASDTLRFAKFFSGDPLPVDAESVLTSLIAREPLNDLDVRYWASEDELHSRLAQVLEEQLSLRVGDTEAFNELFGIHRNGKFWNVDDPDASENWQILSPVRGDLWGVADLNRWVQKSWRGNELDMCRTNRRWTNPFGTNEIIRLDKVLLTQNIRSKRGWDYSGGGAVDEYLANGDIGLCANDRRAKGTPGKGSVMDVQFAGRPGVQFGFLRRDFGGEDRGTMFDLAYALTIHKAQGSDFKTVIVVLPRHSRVNSRELLYTALTRSRNQLVLLVEGDDLAPVLGLGDVAQSDTIRRNSNLFRTSVRGSDDQPWAQHLIHRASDGTPVRSKSELLIMNSCLSAGLRPRYEQKLDSVSADGSYKLPDFTFVTDSGETVVWEHLGMLDLDVYASDWQRKLRWYREQGYVEDETLFTTSEVGGLDSTLVDATIEKVRTAIEEM